MKLQDRSLFTTWHIKIQHCLLKSPCDMDIWSKLRKKPIYEIIFRYDLRKNRKSVLHLPFADKNLQKSLLKILHVDERAWTTNKSRGKLIRDSWGQCQHRTRETTVQHTIFHYWEGQAELHQSVYSKDQEHTRSITNIFMFFALRLLAQQSKCISKAPNFFLL